jgi:hypothetical protein
MRMRMRMRLWMGEGVEEGGGWRVEGVRAGYTNHPPEEIIPEPRLEAWISARILRVFSAEP